MLCSAPPPFLAASAPKRVEEGTDKSPPSLVYLEVQVPHALADAVLQHHENIVVLSHMLLEAGLSEAAVAAHIDTVVASYRDALVASIKGHRS